MGAGVGVANPATGGAKQQLPDSQLADKADREMPDDDDDAPPGSTGKSRVSPAGWQVPISGVLVQPYISTTAPPPTASEGGAPAEATSPTASLFTYTHPGIVIKPSYRLTARYTGKAPLPLSDWGPLQKAEPAGVMRGTKYG